MPTYEYRCGCGEEFTLFQSITAEPHADCPACGKTARRLISGGAGLIFKGSGFYITDYKGKNGGNGGSATPGGKTETAASETKSETPSSASESTKSTESKPDSASKTAKA